MGVFLVHNMTERETQHNDCNMPENDLALDLQDVSEARKAFLMSEIFNRKY